MKLIKKLELYDYFHPRFLYEDPNEPSSVVDTPLRSKALPFEFPLTKEDKNYIIKFMLHFNHRDKRDFTLAAPQIGIPKRMFVFSVPLGRGVVQTFPKSFWLNPTYEGVTDDMEEDFDVCKSVNFAVPVKRYRRINYKAFDMAKNAMVEGEARGFAARVIQHQTDHLDGVLISDLTPKDQFITLQEYRERRKARWNGKGWQDCLEELVQEHKELKASFPPMPKPKKKQRRSMKFLKSKANKKNVKSK